jgi:hypothetical protein
MFKLPSFVLEYDDGGLVKETLSNEQEYNHTLLHATLL